MHPPGEKNWDPEAVTIRRMAASDASAALSLLEESPEASMWSKESLVESASQWIAWVAELDGHVVAFLMGRPAADEFEILNLAVAQKFRRVGFATKLIKVAVDAAQSSGATQIFLEVRASNLPGIALYERLSFQICGRRKNYYRNPMEDAILLIFK